MIRNLLLNIADRISSRSPDFVIGSADDPYLVRWFVIPRNPIFNIYLHCFLRSDDDRALHTHPWVNVSILLRGQYREHLADGVTDLSASDWRLRLSGNVAHRIELTNGPCWTLFITGPRYQEWGFLCPQGFVHWRDFTNKNNSGEVGKGCDA